MITKASVDGKMTRLEISKHTMYNVTEWDWFKLQLELLAIKYHSELYSVLFYFESEEDKVICRIFGKHAESMIHEKVARDEQLEYYIDWVEKEKESIAEVLRDIPMLSKTLNLECDIVYQIMYSYGMGASLICEFRDGNLIWFRNDN